jgi:hypothetical protein
LRPGRFPAGRLLSDRAPPARAGDGKTAYPQIAQITQIDFRFDKLSADFFARCRHSAGGISIFHWHWTGGKSA